MAWRQFLPPALVATWLAGVGRYWDHPSAALAQILGLGSLVYVFVLSGLLWIVIAPLQPRQWSYGAALMLVSLTSPPALLYAIPVERWMSLEGATSINVWFLGVVAVWRVSLLVFALRRFAGLTWPRTLVGAALPLVGVVATLAALNLEKAVFRIMAGIDRPPATPNDGAYAVLVALSFVSSAAALPLLCAYLLFVGRAIVEKRGRVAGETDAV